MIISKKALTLFTTLTFMTTFSGCTPSQISQSLNVASQLQNFSGDNAVKILASQSPALAPYLKAESILRKQLVIFIDEISKKWEKEPKVATPKKYVKYSKNYKSRAEVDFENHQIYIETIDTKNPKASLKEAIVSTLLTPYDPQNVDLHSDKSVKLGAEPFLYNQVLDHEKQPLRWEWRTKNFAEYLLKNSYNSKTIKTQNGDKKVYYVTLSMVKNVTNIQASNLRPIVLKNAKKFNISPALIYAIIETESSFNPYATSAVPAYGLMQIVPKSAGVDTWKFLKNSDGMPSRAYLFNEKNNIEMGSAYLHIVDTKYLKEIKNPISREYCTIAAYNTGSGNVLKAFYKNYRSNRSHATDIINSLTPSEVYSKLRSSLPYDETRRYVQKVTTAKKKYINI